MTKLIEFEDDEIESLKAELDYVIRKEKAEYKRLIQDKKASRIYNEETHDKLIDSSKRMIDILTKIYSKM